MDTKRKSDLVPFLAKTALFHNISEEELEEVLPLLKGRIIQIAAESTFASGGEQIDRIQIVLKGELVVSKILESGEENLIEKLGPGYMVNVAVACSSMKQNPFYVHSTKATEIYEFSYNRLFREHVISDHVRSTLFQNIIYHLASDNIRRQKKIDVLSVNGLRDRIIIYLETRAQMLQKDSFTIPFNREEMANYLCVNRSALSHELSLMRQEGIIDFRKNRFTILRGGLS